MVFVPFDYPRDPQVTASSNFFLNPFTTSMTTSRPGRLQEKFDV